MSKLAKRKSIKISKVKRSNHIRNKLKNRGKVKGKCYGQIKKYPLNKPKPKPEIVEDEEESDHGEDMLSMIEEDDFQFLKNAISDRSYNLLKKIRLNETDRSNGEKKNKQKAEKKSIEDIYEENIAKISEEEGTKKMHMLLPVKMRNGLLEKRIIEKEDNIETEMGLDDEKEFNSNEEDDDDMEIDAEHNDSINQSISTVELLACREETLRAKRLKIGILSSSILENPELKIGNFKVLLELMDKSNPEVYITVRKLATISLLEVFKDLLPSYQILQIQQEGIKLKKETLQLQNYEAALLKYYKIYLQKLEKMCKPIRRKRGDTRPVNDCEVQLSELAVNSMCDLLVTHPYFNFSVNIASFIIPLLDNKRSSVRLTVMKCISQVFKEDKRGELSLLMVRKINQYVKIKGHCIHVEVISVLLSLRIKDVNLDKEKDEEAKKKKLTSHRKRILALSKRERKKNKQLEKIEKELLETKAEENKSLKQQTLTEITSVVFTIYFRILKQDPNSKVLSACLEGLAKFAHCINLDFYQDLVAVVDKLIESGTIGLSEQLHCVQCVFTILSGQGSALTIDPYRFYVHFYRNILNIHVGKTCNDTATALTVLTQMLIIRRKIITQARLVAFVKRIGTLALQLQHNGSLGVLAIIKQIMQLSKAADILLDTDSTTGDGVYQPELEEPEYCNAHCTALWELTLLQRHYHSTVQRIAKNIAWGVPTGGEGSLMPEISKLTPDDLYREFDPTGVAFKPPVPAPKKVKPKIPILNHNFASDHLENYINQICNEEIFINGYVDFYKEYSGIK